jgi:hypothetical protein
MDPMDWKKVNTPTGSKLFKVHIFTFMHKGVNYSLEVDEFLDGTCTGHGEHSTDKSSILEPVSGATVSECLQSLISRIQTR